MVVKAVLIYSKADVDQISFCAQPETENHASAKRKEDIQTGD
jgi:hypothetical protein